MLNHRSNRQRANIDSLVSVQDASLWICILRTRLQPRLENSITPYFYTTCKLITPAKEILEEMPEKSLSF